MKEPHCIYCDQAIEVEWICDDCRYKADPMDFTPPEEGTDTSQRRSTDPEGVYRRKFHEEYKKDLEFVQGLTETPACQIVFAYGGYPGREQYQQIKKIVPSHRLLFRDSTGKISINAKIQYLKEIDFY